MATLTEAARLLWCPGLAHLTGKPKAGVQSWLTTATFSPSVSGKALVLSGVDKHQFLQALAYDINRTASAASETLSNIVEIPAIPKSMGWPYVKVYYSALFYAHVILRLWGESPSYFRTSDFLALRQVLQAYNVVTPFKVQTGQFRLTAKLGQGEVTLSQEVGGATHEALWNAFVASLEALRVEVGGSRFLAADKAKIDQQLSIALNLLTASGSHKSWMSQMRNDINYRQSKGVWYPYASKAKTSSICQARDSMMSGAAGLDAILMGGADELSRFRAACMFVAHLAREMLADMGKIGGAKSFLKFGQGQFETSIVPVD